jgi:hypothetical protein
LDRFAAVHLLFAGVASLGFSERMLVIDQPAPADVILVLDGDSNDLRLQWAVNLLCAGCHETVLRRASRHCPVWPHPSVGAFHRPPPPGNVEVCPGRMVMAFSFAAAIS